MVQEQIGSRRSYLRATVFTCIVILGILADQISKLLAVRALSNGVSIVLVPHVLSLRLLYNPGASFGFGAGHTWVITVVAMLACVGMVIAVWRTTSLQWSATLGLAFAGACGNIIDRVAYASGMLDGKVIDFIDYGWSVGNIADVILAVAAVAMITLLVREVPLRSVPATPAASNDNPPDHAQPLQEA